MAEEEPLATAGKAKINRISTQAVIGEGVSAFESKKFSEEELHTLGLDENDPYYRVEFIENKSISYFMCSGLILSLITGMHLKLYTFHACNATYFTSDIL